MKSKIIDICWFVWDWIAFLAMMPLIFVLYLYYKMANKIEAIKKGMHKRH